MSSPLTSTAAITASPVLHARGFIALKDCLHASQTGEASNCRSSPIINLSRLLPVPVSLLACHQSKPLFITDCDVLGRMRWCHTDLGANVFRWPRLLKEDRRLGSPAANAQEHQAEHFDGLFANTLKTDGNSAHLFRIESKSTHPYLLDILLMLLFHAVSVGNGNLTL